MALTAASFTLASTYSSAGSETSSTVSLSTATVPGDWTLIACALTASSGTITTPAGWTEVLTSTTSTASTSHAAAVYARKFASGDQDPVINHSSGRFAAVVTRVVGADPTTFLDQLAAVDTSTATGSTTVSAPTRTPGTASAVLVTVYTARTNVNGDVLTFTPPTGMTELGEACSTYTGSNAAVSVDVVALGSGTASGAKVATVSGATNGAVGVSFVVKNASTALVSVTATKAAAWNVVGRLTATKATAWNVKELAHVTATAASSWNVIASVTGTKATAWNVRAQVTDSVTTAWNVANAAGGGAPLGQFMIRYVAYAPNGARLGVLTNPIESSAGFPVNDTPALQISYSTAAPGYGFIKDPCEVAVEWSINGSSWAEAPNGRYLRIKRSDDTTDVTGKATYECPGYVWLLGKARIFPSSLDNVDGQRAFSGVRAGTLLKTLINEVKARGGLPGLTFDFTEALDSDGRVWSVPIPSVAFEVGADLLSVLTSLCDQGIIDFATQGRVLRVFNPNTYLARDVSTGTGPVTLTFGRDLTDAPDTATLEDVITDLVVVGDGGVKTTLTNVSAVSPWGRWESLMSQSGVTDVGMMTTLGQAQLNKGARERAEFTRSLTFAAAVWLPFNNYRMGDFIKAPGDDGTLQSVRIMNLTLTTGNEGVVGGSVVLNDRFMDKQLRDSRRLLGITNGSAAGGTGGTPAPAPSADKTIPAAPTGLAYTSSFYLLSNGQAASNVTLSWGAVTKNTDGTTMTDFRGYEVWQKEDVYGSVWHRRTFIESTDTSITLGPFEPRSKWVFTIKARDTPGHQSSNALPWAYVTMAADTQAPNPPSAPAVTPYLGQLVITWDGKDAYGSPMPPDFWRVEVHVSTSSGFTPSAATVVAVIVATAGGQSLLSGIPYGEQRYVKLVAVDRNGNASTPSAQGTGTPTRVANVDVGDGTINGVKIQPGTITADMALFNVAAIQRADIALLAVDDARIANLAVGKLVTGELAADTRVIAGKDTADHAEMRADGFAVVSHDINGDPYDVVRLGNATEQFFTIPDVAAGPETSLASIDSDGNASFQGLDVSGVDDTNTGMTVYGRDFSEWVSDLPGGQVAQSYGAGSTTPIDATADIGLVEVSFQFVQGRHYAVHWNGIHTYSGTSLTSGQIRMIHTHDGTAPSPTNGDVDAAQFIVPNNTTSIGNFATSPPMSVMGDWGDDGDTIRVAIFARRYYGTGVFNVLTSGGAAYVNPYRLWVEDIGPANPNSFAVPGSSTVKKTYVTTFPATWTRLWTAAGVSRGDTTDAIQGYDKLRGDGRAAIGFKDMTAALSGVTAANIKKVEVYLYCNYTGLATGGTAKIGFHGSSTAPASMLSTTVQLSTHFARPQGRWVTLPLVNPGNWITGAWRGITLGQAGSTSAAYYMRFNGYSNPKYKPAMRITYLK